MRCSKMARMGSRVTTKKTSIFLMCLSRKKGKLTELKSHSVGPLQYIRSGRVARRLKNIQFPLLMTVSGFPHTTLFQAQLPYEMQGFPYQKRPHGRSRVPDTDIISALSYDREAKFSKLKCHRSLQHRRHSLS